MARTKSKAPPARFAKGDAVRVTRAAAAVPLWDATGRVRRVFWAVAGGGQPAGWVCELDIPFGPDGRFVAVWERLLDAAAE